MGTCKKRSAEYLIVRMLFILMTGVFCSFSYAEMSPMPPRLVGTVLDAETGQPVINAHIYLENSSEGVIVTDNGTFEFINVPAENYSLTVSHIAYVTDRQTVDLKEGCPLYLTIRLHKKVIQNEPVTFVSQSHEPSYVIDYRDIKNMSWNDVGDAIKSIPSAHVMEEGGLGSRKTVSFHGAKPEQVLVLIDGVALNSGDGKAVDLAEIPLNNIQSIKVNPEASPGAVGGTINIVTRSISSGTGRITQKQVSAEGQQPGAISLNGAVDSGDERGYSGITVRYLSNDGKYNYKNENGITKQRYNNKRERISFSLKHRRSIINGFDYGILLFGEDYSSGVPGPLYQAPTTDATLEERFLNGRLFFEKKSETRVNKLTFSGFTRERFYENPQYQYNPEINAWVYHTPQNIRDFNDVYQATYRNEGIQDKALNMAFESSVKLEKFSSENRLGNGTTEERLIGDIYRTWYSGSLKTDLNESIVSVRNRIHAHLRVDSYGDQVGGFEFNTGPTEWSGKAGYILNHPETGLSWNTSIAKAYAPPSFVSRFLVESAFTYGNPELKPEKIEEFSTGIHFNRHILAGSVTLSVKGFLRKTEDKIIWRRNWRGQYFPDNLEEAEGRGVDSFLEWINRENPFFIKKLGANLTLQDIRNSTKTSPYYDKIVPFQPSYLGMIYISLKTYYDFYVNVDYRFSGRRYTQESNLDVYTIAGDGLEPYEVLNISLFREWTPVRGVFFKTTIGVENLNNETYELIDRMPMPGRIWRIKLEFKS